MSPQEIKQELVALTDRLEQACNDIGMLNRKLNALLYQDTQLPLFEKQGDANG